MTAWGRSGQRTERRVLWPDPAGQQPRSAGAPPFQRRPERRGRSLRPFGWRQPARRAPAREGAGAIPPSPPGHARPGLRDEPQRLISVAATHPVPPEVMASNGIDSPYSGVQGPTALERRAGNRKNVDAVPSRTNRTHVSASPCGHEDWNRRPPDRQAGVAGQTIRRPGPTLRGASWGPWAGNIGLDPAAQPAGTIHTLMCCVPEACTFRDPELHEMTRRFSPAATLARTDCRRGAVPGASHVGRSN